MPEPTEMLPEETLDPEDWEAMRALGHRLLDDTFDYLKSLREQPAWRHAPREVKAHFEGPPPQDPTPAEEVYREYVRYILPYQMGNHHPRFWGWVAGNGTVMGMFAELLAAATDAICGVLSYNSNNYVELQVIDWCKTLLGYPAQAGGLLTSGCSAANIIGLAVARQARAGYDQRKKGLCGAPRPLTLYCSKEAHSSVQKAVELLGFGSEALRRIPVNASLQMDLAALRAALREDRAAGLHPICVVGGAGTTNTGAIDDLPGLADLCTEEGLWFHVDGAFGAWAAISPRYKHLVAGLERADSLAFDLHKWLYLPYPIGCILVRNAHEHRHAFSLTPTYLAHGKGKRGLTGVDVPWLADYGFELSRGFQALKAWMTIKEHGTAKYGRIIQQNIDQAQYLAGLVEAASELELALPVSLNVVCFRFVRPGLGEAALNQLNKEIEIELQEQGIAVPSVVRIKGRKYLHVAITNHRSRREDFDLLVREVIRIGKELA
ncbi:MAG: aminotransferase class V-fold PLP-dependent enzyme [Deltaproteobacteria bacterium]|nr:aminotransferase class V-fold PLP-dependent enzyme [Deltaproteobacteria bacterium]